MHPHRTLPIGILVLATLAAAATAGAYPYCTYTYACSVPPRESCDTLCYECTGVDAGPEEPYDPPNSCSNPTLIRVRDICCPCIDSTGEEYLGPDCHYYAATGLFDREPEAQLCSLR